jgi:hypothetical protein
MQRKQALACQAGAMRFVTGTVVPPVGNSAAYGMLPALASAFLLCFTNSSMVLSGGTEEKIICISVRKLSLG